MSDKKNAADYVDVGVTTDAQVLHASPVLQRHTKNLSFVIGEELGYVSVDVGAISEDQEQFNKKTPHANENCFESLVMAENTQGSRCCLHQNFMPNVSSLDLKTTPLRRAAPAPTCIATTTGRPCDSLERHSKYFRQIDTE